MVVKMAEEGLLDDKVIHFSDTGREHEECYKFVERVEEFIGVPILRLKAGEGADPFRELIVKQKFLPNAVMRFCTVELKIIPMQRLMIELGFKDYINYVGFRVDEQNRIMNKRGGSGFAVSKKTSGIRQDVEVVEAQRNASDYELYHMDYEFPLVDFDMTKRDVLKFWRKMPFDLESPLGGDSNCVFCFHKSFEHKVAMAQERPELLTPWLEDEALIKGSYNKTHSLESVLEFAKRQRSFNFDVGDSMSCGCTD